MAPHLRLALVLPIVFSTVCATHAFARPAAAFAQPLSPPTLARRGTTIELDVPVPTSLRATREVRFDLRSTGVAVVVSRMDRGIVSPADPFVRIAVSVPSDAPAGILDVADVVFVGDSSAEILVPILLRIASIQDEEADTSVITPPERTRLAAVTTVVRSALAEWFTVGKWSIGGEASLLTSKMAGRTAGFDQGRLSASSSVLLERQMGGPWSLRTGVGLARRGGSSVVSGSTVAVSMSYVEFPVLARYRLAPIKMFEPSIFGGATFAISTDCRLRFVGLGGPSSSESCDDGTGYSEPRRRDVGLTIGGSAQTALKSAMIEIGVRRTTGLVSIEAPIDAKHQGWNMSLTAWIPAERAMFWRHGARSEQAPIVGERR